MNTSVIIYGGSFNPVHAGHLNVVEKLKEKYTDDKVVLMPSFKSPLKEFDYDPGIDHRLKIAKIAFQEFGVEVDDFEKDQGKKCYTVDTLPYIKSKYPNNKIKLVIGQDQLKSFHLWKDFQKVLTEVDLLVVSRPGYDFLEYDEFPEEIKILVADYSEVEFTLTTGKKIQYFDLDENVDISSSKLRSVLRKGEAVGQLIPEQVQTYFKENGIYDRLDKKVDDYKAFTIECYDALKEKNALGVLAYDVRNISQPSEFNIIASGTNVRHTSALAEHLIRHLRKSKGLSPLAIEGLNEGRWVVIDYGSLIVHVFYDFVRNEYNLEELWSEGSLIKGQG